MSDKVCGQNVLGMGKLPQTYEDRWVLFRFGRETTVESSIFYYFPDYRLVVHYSLSALKAARKTFWMRLSPKPHLITTYGGISIRICVYGSLTDMQIKIYLN